VEFARNVVGIEGADHPGLNPDASEFVIAPLACSVVGQERPVLIAPGTLAGQLYLVSETVEPFFCTFGLNPAYRSQFEESGMVFSGSDRDGVPRVLEVPGHPFFLATLYIPQAAPAQESPHPVLAGLVSAED
jgi:CTP synthase (UTP-ammonia lyase)